MNELYAPLADRFGAALRRNDPLARYTVARLGGPADALLIAGSMPDLTHAIKLAHEYHIPWIILGGGANVLIADKGYRGLVIVNHTRAVRLNDDGTLVAESGANLTTVARRCMSQGWAGLEWAVNVPGTVGGAVINNAGAHGGEMSQSLLSAELLELGEKAGIALWPVEKMAYAYRYSALKGQHGRYVVLSAQLRLEPGHDPAALNEKADGYIAHRKRTQPPGASLGSIFKNPPGDYAGRLLEAAGLKGQSIGGVLISPVHANFFINTGHGTAHDYFALIQLARETVEEKFGVRLELEIETLGEW